MKSYNKRISGKFENSNEDKKHIKNQREKFRRLEKIMSRNIFFILFCAIFSIFSAVSILASTLSNHFEYVSYDMITIKNQIENKNNQTIRLIELIMENEIALKDLVVIRQITEDKTINERKSHINQMKIKNLFKQLKNNYKSFKIFEIEIYFDYYILKYYEYLGLNKTISKTFLIYEIHSGIWKYCNNLSGLIIFYFFCLIFVMIF